MIRSGFGAVVSRRVAMTAMPQLVAIFNGVGGGAAALVALIEFSDADTRSTMSAALFTMVIGGISFAGSAVTFLKLQELITGRPITFPGGPYLFGVFFVLPVGGADVPIVISLLNALAGLAVAASGYVLSNTLLVVAGTLVGASGTILTRMMASAMGRSVVSILFGAFKGGSMAGSTARSDRPVRSGTRRTRSRRCCWRSRRSEPDRRPAERGPAAV